MIKFENPMPHERLKKWGNPEGKTTGERKSGMFLDSHEIKNNPNYIVKELRRGGEESWLKLNYGENFSLEDIAKETQKFIDVAKNASLDFLPRTRIIIAKNEDGIETLYLITKKIKGENVIREGKYDLGDIGKSDKEQLISAVDKLIDVYIKSFDEQTKTGLTIEFWKIANYIKEDGGKIFLVDLTPVYDFSFKKFADFAIEFLRRLHLSNDKIFRKIMKIHDNIIGPVENKYELPVLKEIFGLDKK